jgi:hypothetical protein
VDRNTIIDIEISSHLTDKLLDHLRWFLFFVDKITPSWQLVEVIFNYNQKNIKHEFTGCIATNVHPMYRADQLMQDIPNHANWLALPGRAMSCRGLLLGCSPRCRPMKTRGGAIILGGVIWCCSKKCFKFTGKGGMESRSREARTIAGLWCLCFLVSSSRM